MTMTPLDHAVNNLEIYTNAVPGVNIKELQKILSGITHLCETEPYSMDALWGLVCEINIIIGKILDVRQCLSHSERNLIFDLFTIRRDIYDQYKDGVSMPIVYVRTASPVTGPKK